MGKYEITGETGIFPMFDVCIIGVGGVVGCAIARELAQRGLSVAGVEKHKTACQETSGLNSRVIHSGFHEIPGTLKAGLAREGSRLIIEYAQQRRIQLLNTGMLIAVPHGSIRAGLWREADALWNLWRTGRRQQVVFTFVVTPGGIRKLAPIRAIGGIFIPSVCVIDLEAFVQSLADDAQAAGAKFFYGSEVTKITVGSGDHRIHTAGEEIHARILVNSAGLHAHTISEMAGGPKYDIEFIRGDYYELLGGIDRWGVRRLIYPATPPHSPSKGVHFGPRTDGRLYIGPSATPPSAPAPKQMFLDAARRFLPNVRDSDLQWAYAGVRPKRTSQNGKSDFTIRLDRATPPLVNLIGIDSPGLSSSMAIAQFVSRLLLT
jgi:glycerol-3-phosphate dehydrogenase